MLLLNMYHSTEFTVKWFLITAIAFCLTSNIARAQTNVYLIPGQGSDARLYQDLKLSSDYKIHHVKWAIPSDGMSMHTYAQYLAQQVDQNKPFVLIGTSLGGMLATEMSTFLAPEKTIIISSAKCRKELPHRYRFQKLLPIYDLVPPEFSKRGALILQPIVEPDRNNNKEVFVSMLKDKPPLFLKRTIQMIIEWKRTEAPDHIIHIHGDKDHTLPHKHVQYDYLIKEGSHMMALTRAEEISELIQEILDQE